MNALELVAQDWTVDEAGKAQAGHEPIDRAPMFAQEQERPFPRRRQQRRKAGEVQHPSHELAGDRILDSDENLLTTGVGSSNGHGNAPRKITEMTLREHG